MNEMLSGSVNYTSIFIFLTGNTLADRSISLEAPVFFIDLSSPFSYHCVFLTLNSL